MGINTNYGDVALWTESLTRIRSVVSSNPVKSSRCFIEHDTLPSLLSTGWFQEWIGRDLHKQIWFFFNNRTEIIKYTLTTK